jgi:GAF domain-containing protein
LTRFLVTDVSVGDTLQRITEITLEALPSAEIAGITMLDDDERPITALFSDKRSPEIDAAQYDSGRGPCLDASREGRLVRLNDFDSAAARYPEFIAAARAHGVLSTLSLPLIAAERGIGALNLYSHQADGFSDADQDLGMALAASAAVVLANVSAYWTAFELGQNLSQAMETRGVIEQAKGMLMAQSPTMTADDAFDVLRKASQRENVKLREIAARIVARQPLSGPQR